MIALGFVSFLTNPGCRGGWSLQVAAAHLGRARPQLACRSWEKSGACEREPGPRHGARGAIHHWVLGDSD